MRIRNWQDVLQELISKDSDPQKWRAISGIRSGGIGEDLYLCHPGAGLYHLKTYAKNPFEVQGVGTRLVNKIDGGISDQFPREVDGRFAIHKPIVEKMEVKKVTQRVEETLRAHVDAPTTSLDLFEDVMVAIGSPAYGPLDYRGIGNRPESLDMLAREFQDMDRKLELKLEEMIKDDGIGKGFG